jgi:P-type conjugative transfer protein TrbG
MSLRPPPHQRTPRRLAAHWVRPVRLSQPQCRRRSSWCRLPLRSTPRRRTEQRLRAAGRTAGKMPTTGPDGVVRYLYGATMPSIVCAPLMVCALELQPGEVVQPPVTLGDSVRWKVMPGMSGDGASRTTLVMIKPTDAGLVTNMVLPTNRRVYSVKLVSTQHQWMPRVAFDYPDDTQNAWGAYQMKAAFGAAASALATGESTANLDFGFRLSGDNPGWKPVRVYTDGLKTFIEFAPAAMHAEAPALVALADDGGWFSKPSSQVVNYRQMGNRFVVDSVLSKAALVSGVGGSETRVTITRESSR